MDIMTIQDGAAAILISIGRVTFYGPGDLSRRNENMHLCSIGGNSTLLRDVRLNKDQFSQPCFCIHPFGIDPRDLEIFPAGN
ncbi:hypothetical protein ACH5RR_002161 [Cinchona calisaya]|uniref:Uncharacterized protein n=1 Tax=Cinchona calisaya TaxID=153742 RepID=A0ABD3B5H1_9GENT